METIEVVDWGLIEYGAAYQRQREAFDALTEAKRRGQAGRQMLLLCEHPHVYTLGKSGTAENLLVSEAFLQSIGATYFNTDRGGDITYHGYGQLVGYPILDLERLGMGLKTYINVLEESVIRTVADFGLRGERLDGATGVWLEAGSAQARKICAIGVKASRFVTMHGFALNVNTDLNYFSHINPCGFTDKGVTSLRQELGRAVEMEEVKRLYIKHFFECMEEPHKSDF
ncbi:MAG: lipoyl(octanoyl) transferase LipB [Rikenellaceae bacterium]|jgi:lipoyl(octanoyl) transferase|nr:lipoyl(octanoyl) transferase LipB [Rikenellaceae bacterium]